MMRVTIPDNDPELFTLKGYKAMIRRLNDWRIAIETAERVEVTVGEESDGDCKPGHSDRPAVGIQTAEIVGKV
jgi:hypothetical protein